jgi:hypothetical protein
LLLEATNKKKRRDLVRKTGCEARFSGFWYGRIAVTHLRKVELVGKLRVVQRDKTHAHPAQDHQTQRLELQSLDLRSVAPQAARARALGLTRKHMTGIATMLRYLSNNQDHALSGKLLSAGGPLSRIAS